MAEAGPIRRIVVPFVCLAVTAAGINNVYGDTSEVEALAEQTACGKDNCAVKILEASKTPFGHTYVYQTSVADQGKARVECARAMFLVGAYACERK
jgi:hypothetical protein